jgi:dTDP-4-dehydrorhamnose reductase
LKPRLLIIGATGFVGSRLALAADPHFEVWRGSRHPAGQAGDVTIDVTDDAAVRAAFAEARPQFVVHLAALSDIDRCEREPDVAWEMNVSGTIHVANACAAGGARLLYTSTDNVFDGTRGSYREDDPPTPPNVYGRTKVRAEQTIAALAPAALVVRLSLVLGTSALAGGNSYLEKVMGNLRAGNPIISPTYEYRNPLDVHTLCTILLELLPMSDASGIVHAGASDKISRFDLARAIALRLNAEADLIVPQTAPVPGRAPRGADNFLATDRLRVLCATPVPSCGQVIERAIPE